jgi:hypothetical protein
MHQKHLKGAQRREEGGARAREFRNLQGGIRTPNPFLAEFGALCEV